MYHGYVQSYSVGQQLENLIEQIPQEYRARVVASALVDNPYDTVRNLVMLVNGRVWEDLDPSTPAERDLDEWQAETATTRESDYPR